LNTKKERKEGIIEHKGREEEIIEIIKKERDNHG